jgi:hypothetical protein
MESPVKISLICAAVGAAVSGLGSILIFKLMM